MGTILRAISTSSCELYKGIYIIYLYIRKAWYVNVQETDGSWILDLGCSSIRTKIYIQKKVCFFSQLINSCCEGDLFGLSRSHPDFLLPNHSTSTPPSPPHGLVRKRILCWTSGRWVVAGGGLTTSCNSDVLEFEVGARSTSTKNIVIDRTSNRGTRDTAKIDSPDDNAICWLAGWPAVQVVLLNNKAILGDATHLDVGVCDVLDKAGGAGVGLDAASVATVGDGRIREGNSRDDVVGFSPDGADGESMSS